MKAKDEPRSNAFVRYELYLVLNEIIESQNYHLQSWSTPPNQHVMPCRVCEGYSDKRQGLFLAIRHFGGKPRP